MKRFLVFITIALFLSGGFAWAANDAGMASHIGTLNGKGISIGACGLQIEANAADPTDSELANGRLSYLTGTGLRVYAESAWVTLSLAPALLTAHLADITDPHGASMSVSTRVITPVIKNTGNVTIDAYGTGTTNIYLTNSDSGATAISIGDSGDTISLKGTTLNATATELNVLNGIAATLTTAELNYSDGVTSAIQTQFSNKQPLDTTLTSIALLGTAADKMLYSTGVDTWAEAAITAAGIAILDDADAAAQRVTLSLGNVDNTSDANKPISTATQTALDLKIAKTTWIYSVDDTGIADGEICIFDKTNNYLETANVTIATTMGADDTTVPTSGAMKTVTDLLAPIANATFTGVTTMAQAVANDIYYGGNITVDAKTASGSTSVQFLNSGAGGAFNLDVVGTATVSSNLTAGKVITDEIYNPGTTMSIDVCSVAAATLNLENTDAGGLNVSVKGTQAVDGVFTAKSYETHSLEAAISAYNPGGFADATELTKTINIIGTCGTTNDSVKVTNTAVGTIQYITNNGAQSLAIYGFDGSSDINGAGAGEAKVIATNTTLMLIHKATNDFEGLTLSR